MFQGLNCLWMVSVTLILNCPQKIVQRCQITAWVWSDRAGPKYARGSSEIRPIYSRGSEDYPKQKRKIKCFLRNSRKSEHFISATVIT